MSKFGKSRLFDEDDDEDDREENDPSSFGYGGGGGGGGGKNKNPFDDDADEDLLRMRAQISLTEDSCLESTKRALASIADSEKVGVATAEELLSQREQLERVDERLDETQTTLKASQRSLNGIKSVWGGLTNMFKKKEALIPPSPVKSSRAVPQTRLKGVVNDLDDDDDADRSAAARSTTNRGVDVGGFFVDEDDSDARGGGLSSSSRGVSRSSTTSSSGFGQTRQRGSDGANAKTQIQSARMREVDDNLDLMSEGLGKLKNLAVGLNEEIEAQNDILDRINDKVMDTDDTLWHQQKQIKRILK